MESATLRSVSLLESPLWVSGHVNLVFIFLLQDMNKKKGDATCYSSSESLIAMSSGISAGDDPRFTANV